MPRLFSPAVIVILMAISGLRVQARTWLVLPDGSGDVATIRDAVVQAADWDTIELGDGVFTGFGNRDIEVGTKWLTIRSQSGDPEACVIDIQGSDAANHRGLVYGTGG